MTVVLHVYILYCSVSFSICLSHMQDVETVWFILHPWHGSPHLWLLHLPLVCTVELIALHWKKGPHYIIVRSRVCDLRSLLQWYCALEWVPVSDYAWPKWKLVYSIEPCGALSDPQVWEMQVLATIGIQEFHQRTIMSGRADLYEFYCTQ